MKVVVSGGGTGGHIYPALALIHHIQKVDPTTEFLYIGTEKGLEKKIVEKEQIPFKTIEIQGFKRSLSLYNVKTVQLFLKAIKRSKQLLEEFQPDVVIGTGGYVCGAVVYAAHKLNIPTMIHEQNSVAGVTNKFLSKYVDKVGICFPEVATAFPEQKVVFTGNPRGQEVVEIDKQEGILEQYGLKTGIPTILIFGGSRGALTINNAVLEAMPELVKKDYQVLYVPGNYYYEEVMKQMPQEHPNISVQPYIDQMPEVLVNVELVLARAGATTLAELTALGLPSILVPSPNVTNDHQTKNAKSLVDAGASVLLKDDELNGTSLVQAIDQILLQPDELQQMTLKAKEQGVPDASQRVYEVLQEISHS